MAGLEGAPAGLQDALAAQLAAACSRSALPHDALLSLRRLFPEARLIRLSFGLANKVMVSVNVDLQHDRDGSTHTSFVPIHPSAAAAAVLQNNPVVVVRTPEKRSPLWDQEDLYGREGCRTVNVVSMPFVWEPPPNALGDGRPLPMPQSRSLHPTFGALTAGTDEPLRTDEIPRLQALARQTGRHVGPHIAMLLASLEGAALVPNELQAQDDMRAFMEPSDEEGEASDGSEDDAFGFGSAAVHANRAHSVIMGLAPPEEAPAAAAAAGAGPAAPHGAGLAAGPAAAAEEEEGEGEQAAAAAAAPDPLAELPAMAVEMLLAMEGRAAGMGMDLQEYLRRGLQEMGQAGIHPELAGVVDQPGGSTAAARQQAQQQAQQAQQQQAEPAGALAVAAADASTGAAADGAPAGAPAAPIAPAQAGPVAGPADAAAGPSHAAGRSRVQAPPPASTPSSEEAAHHASVPRAGSAARRAAGSATPSTPSTPDAALALAGLPLAGTLHPWSRLTFEAPGLERDFALHYGRKYQKADVAAWVLLLLAMLAAMGLHMRALWPAGLAGMLLFAPYYFDYRLYRGLRDGLLSAALLLSAAFLGSLTSMPRAGGGSDALGASSCPAGADGVSDGAAAGMCSAGGSPGASSRSPGGSSGAAQLEGFGICWFVLHTCGLAYVLAAPLLLRLRLSRALPVQGANLALALHRLPHAYTATLGHLDTAHVLLLGLLLVAGAGGALLLAREQERRMREAWLLRRMRRLADTLDVAQRSSNSGSQCSLASSQGRRAR